MKRLEHERLIRDDRAVALTECAIIMPVVLLFFLAILQYFEFVRDSQMVNYAAYVAARTYAVQAAVNPSGASYDANKAAVMALAPISDNLSLIGLIPGAGGAMSGISSFFSTLSSAVPGAGNYVTGLASAEASLYGNFTCVSNGVPGNSSLGEVNVTINYPQVINIAGFAGLWGITGGNGIWGTIGLGQYAFNYQMYQLANGLTTIDKAISFIPGTGVVNIPGECTLEYETWGS